MYCDTNETEGAYKDMGAVVDKEKCTITLETTHFSEYSVCDLSEYRKAINNPPDYSINDGNAEWNGVVAEPNQIPHFDEELIFELANNKNFYVLHATAVYNLKSGGQLRGEIMYLSNEPMGDVYLANFNDEGRVVIDVIGRKYLSGGYLSGDNYEFGLNADGVGVALPYYKDIAQPDFGGLENVTKYFVPIGGGNYKDSDNDGLYDVQEEQGMMLSNGKIIKTDPYNRDTDGDGLSDGEEMGKYNAVRGYFPCHSNPLDRDTDDDGYEDGDDAHPRVVARWTEQYEKIKKYDDKDIARFQKSPTQDFYSTPQTQKAYYDQHFNTRNAVYNQGLLVYNLEKNLEMYTSVYGEVIDHDYRGKKLVGVKISTGKYLYDTEYLNKKIKDVYTLLAFTDFEGSLFKTAGSTLGHFMEGTGEDLSLEVSKLMLTSEMHRQWLDTNAGKLRQHIEDVLKPSETMIIDTQYLLNASLYKPIMKNVNNFIYWPAFGQMSASIIADVSYTEGVYNVKFRYVIFDYYDWEFGSNAKFVGVADGDLFAIECCGFGQSYYICGENEYRMLGEMILDV